MTSEPTATSNSRAVAESQVRALYQKLIEAWNVRSAEHLAALFASEGSLVGFDGSMLDGSAEIEALLKNIFVNHPTASFVSIVREVRMLADDVAMLRAVVGMVPPGKSELNPAVNAVQTLVAVRQHGRWQVALFQNTPAAFHGQPDQSARLTAELTQVLRSRSS